MIRKRTLLLLLCLFFPMVGLSAAKLSDTKFFATGSYGTGDFFVVKASAAGEASSLETVISDSAGLLSTDEADVMERNLGYIKERYGASVYLITSDTIGEKDDYKAYIKEQYKKIEKKKNMRDMLFLFVSVKKKEELCYIRAYGTAKKNLTRKRLSGIERSVEKKLIGGEEEEALNLLYGKLLGQMGTDPFFDSVFFHPLFHLIVCILLTAGILFACLHRAGDRRQKAVPYLDEKYSTLQGRVDHFSHTSIKVVKKKGKQKKEKNQE